MYYIIYEGNLLPILLTKQPKGWWLGLNSYHQLVWIVLFQSLAGENVLEDVCIYRLALICTYDMLMHILVNFANVA